MNPSRRALLQALGASRLVGGAARPGPEPDAVLRGFDIRRFGAVGDGRTLDTAAINRAIAAAAASGGGTVHVPAGSYACHSLHLKSCIELHLAPGATLLAAEDVPGAGYDAPEPAGPWETYQDFGHDHWHNSLIWGEDLHDIAITGPGRIWGRGLVRELSDAEIAHALTIGAGNKAIALKRCHNVTLRDFSILAGGHFGILATGVDNVTIDNLRIDTNRDGMDIDCCRNVRITNCSVNAPWDDAICLKSSDALGEPRMTQDVTISNCAVSGGWRLGAMLDGSFRRFAREERADPGQRTGRIKLGTESDAGFRNITIADCVFQSCRGLALETVDGGVLEDVAISNVTMRDLRNAPIFLRLGARMRGPAGRLPGRLARVSISNLVCSGSLSSMPAIIAGIPGFPVEDIRINDVVLQHGGGAPAAMAEVRPPEEASDYPDPSAFVPLPAQGFFIRHARNIELGNVEFETARPDERPLFWLQDVDGIDLFRIQSRLPVGVAAFTMQDVRNFRLGGSVGLPDMVRARVARSTI